MIRVSESRLHSAWWALRLSFGLVPFLAGLDKFFNILTDWTQYQSPILQQVLPISATTFMRVAGVIEMIVGIAILTRWTRVGSYVAVRDLVLAVGAYTLASLTEAMVEPAASAQRIHGNAKQAHSPGLEA